MRGLDATLPPADGVAWFNKLYLAVTEAVAAELGRGAFEDARFTERLDVVFAGLYLAALDADPGRAPRAWVALFEARRRPRLLPIQFALAGMNAHINRDLPLALVAVRRELGIDLRRGTPQHRDFTRVNLLLEVTEARVKAWLAAGVVGVADRRLGRVDDAIAMWNVSRARDAAWTNGEALWALREVPELHDAFLLSLDRLVGFAGRGLLAPVEPAVRRRIPLPGWLRRLLGR